MLAYLPMSSPFEESHSITATTSSTMSVAILPSAPVTLRAPIMMMSSRLQSPAKRPKLSLDTASPITETSPYRSKASTSLRLETLSATSPTARNTFGNGYGQARRPKLAKLSMNTPKAASFRSNSLKTPDSATSSPIFTGSPLIQSFTISAPLHKKTTSILRKTSSDDEDLPTKTRVLPSVKKVVFRSTLTEEITNKRYTLRHSDIESISIATPKPEKVEVKAQTSDEEENEDETDDHGCPVTPVAGRRKRDRQWYWTLGPVEGQNNALLQKGSHNDSRIMVESQH